MSISRVRKLPRTLSLDQTIWSRLEQLTQRTGARPSAIVDTILHEALDRLEARLDKGGTLSPYKLTPQ